MRLDPDIAGELCDAAKAHADQPSSLSLHRLQRAVVTARANDLANRERVVKGEAPRPGHYGT